MRHAQWNSHSETSDRSKWRWRTFQFIYTAQKCTRFCWVSIHFFFQQNRPITPYPLDFISKSAQPFLWLNDYFTRFAHEIRVFRKDYDLRFLPNSDLSGTPNGTQFPIGFKWAVWNNYVRKAISRLIFTHHLGNTLKYLLIC